MKALIFNSGIGSRMGALTAHRPKCLLPLGDGENIFARQLRLLAESGVTEVIVTTGQFEQALLAESLLHPELRLTFVQNPLHASTNYIYSLYLAREMLDGDLLMLHGDLVFDSTLIGAMLSDSRPSLCLVNPHIRQPEKDFKGRIENGLLRQVAVDIFDENCYALQPLYKLSASCMRQWLAEVSCFVREGITHVYAENALNRIAYTLQIEAMDYDGHYIKEIDIPADYERVSREISAADSGVFFSLSGLEGLLQLYEKPFAVMGGHLAGSPAETLLDQFGTGKFFGVKENPDDVSIAAAQKAFEAHGGDLLVSIGGGSAMDTAKAVKYNLRDDPRFAKLPHIAIPTTAGSGSEATHFSVMYHSGVKHSLAEPSLLPEHVILDSRLLYSLSPQQRKVSLLDALCHSIESILSGNACDESNDYALYAIKTILADYRDFIDGNTEVYEAVQLAAYYAGRAINLTKTTVGHAMSYVLTSHYGIRHGQAVTLCLAEALRYAEGWIPPQARCLYDALGCRDGQGIGDRLSEIYQDMALLHAFDLQEANPVLLAESVNIERLSNSAISFTDEAIADIYSAVIVRVSALKKTS